MNGKLKSLLLSRRFWVAATGLAAVISSEAFGFTLNTEQIISISSIVIAWIVGDTMRVTK